MLAANDARRLLGDDGKHFSDEQVQLLIKQLTVIAEITLDVVFEDCADSSDLVS
ncbi:MAG: hypothetical protein ABIA92_01335 [Patescibacteria group bacterium]